MPIVDYGNLGTIEFPDDMSNEDIQAYISANGDTIKRDLAAKQRARFESETIAESPKPSILDRLGAGFAAFNQGISQLPQGVLGAAGALSDALVPSELPDREAQSFLSAEEERAIRQRARESGGETPGDFFRSAKSGAERFTEAVSPVDPRAEGFLNTDVPRGLGQAAAQIGLGMSTGGAGLAGQAVGVGAATAGEFTDAYERELARQVRDGEEPDTTKALLKSGLYSAAVAALESKLGVGRLIEKLGKPAVDSLAVSIAKNALAGGIEEASERAIQDLIVEGKTDTQGPLREGAVGAIVQGLVGIPGAVQGRRNETLAEAGAVRAQKNLDRRRAAEAAMLPSEPVVPEFEDRYAGPPVATPKQQTAQALKQANEFLATQQRQETRMKLADARQQGAAELAQAAGVEAPQVEVVRPNPVAPPPLPAPAPTPVSDRTLRALGFKVLTSRGVAPDVAAAFVNVWAQTANPTSTEDARSQIVSAFQEAGGLDAGANTFSTEQNLRAAAEANGLNESDIQNALYDRRKRDAEIAENNKRVIEALTGAPIVAPAKPTPTPPNAAEIQVPQASPPAAQPVVAPDVQPEVPPEVGAALGSGQGAQGEGGSTERVVVAPQLESPVRENGGRTSLVLPNGTALVGGRIHAQTYQAALDAGVATEDELANSTSGFTRPDGTTWNLQGDPVPVSKVVNLGSQPSVSGSDALTPSQPAATRPVLRSPATLSAAQINRELDRIDKQSSQLTDEMIEAGRGRELASETLQKSDPLALRFKALFERRSALRSEIDARYGPGAPSRLPSRGFGARERPETELSAAPAQPVVTDRATAPVVPKFGDVYQTSVSGRGQMWAARTSDNERGFGDELYATREEAEAAAKNAVRRKSEKESAIASQQAKQAAESAAKESSEELGGFTSSMTNLAASRARNALSPKMNYRGEPISRRDLIRRKVSEGARVVTTKEGRVLQNRDESYLTQKVLTKIGLDYAEWLSSQPQPAQPPSTADRIISKIDEWDAQLKTPGVSSDPFFLRPQVRLVLQLAKGAIRAGQAISTAVRNAVRQARSQNPADDTRDSEIQTRLEDLLNGFSNPNAIGQVAEPIVARNESAAQSLDEDALQADRRRQAWKQLRDLRDQVVSRALAANLDARDVPTDVLSDEFATYAAARGLGAVPVQEFLRFERKASNLATLIKQRENLVRLAETLRQVNPRKYADNIEEYETMAGRMQLRIDKAAKTAYNGQSALERADEINQSRDTAIDRQAQRDALQHPEVRSAIVGPVEALRAIREEFPELQARSPVEVLQDPEVDEDRKRMIAGRLDQAFREFGYSQQMVEDEVANERPKLEALINKLRSGLADTNDKRNYAEIAMDDARRARGGEHGLTGTLEDQEWLNWFNQNQGSLRSFAAALARADAGDVPAQQLIEWLTQSPVGAPPLVRNAAQGQYGVSDEVLSETLKALEASPAVRNAVAAIYSHGTKRIPAQVLAEIAQAAAGGDTEYADRLLTELLDSQSSVRDAAISRANEIKGQLDDAQLRLKTLEEAANLFQRIVSDPAFAQYKQAAELASAFTEQMVVANDEALILKPFKADGIEQVEISPTTKALENPKMFSERSLPAIAEYATNAKAYVSGYETALSAWGVDPIANPPPVTLGYDTAVYNGLKDALANELPALLDTTNFFADQRIEVGGFNLFGQTNSFQRQILRSAQLIDGIFGSSLRKAMTEYSNTRLAIGRVMANKEFRRLPALLTRAMASHPEIGGKGWSSRIPLLGPKIQRAFAPGGNQEVYRREVFNPMADEGRKFGSRLEVGYLLPTGHRVTQADMDYLELNRKFNLALLRVAQARPTSGTAVELRGGRELRRRAGSVGDYGLPRHLSPAGQTAVETMAGVYSDPKKVSEKITPATDLTQRSTNPLVQMWNELANRSEQFLKYHVVDARRDDRAIAISPYMRQAYRSLADEMERGGYQGNITSLDDLVNRLVANFPQDTGLSVRDYIVEQLANELGAYAGLAIEVYAKRKASKSRGKSLMHVEVESSNNEFTRPAAKLLMPSSLYDYGSVGVVDGLLAAARAAGERTVNVGLALQAAANEARQRSDAAKVNPSLLKEVDEDPVKARQFLNSVASIGDALSGDIGRDYTPPFFLFRWARGLFGGLAALQLMSRVAQVTNIISAAVPEYLLMSRIHPAGKRFAALLFARNTASTIAKSTLRVAEKLTGLVGINSAGRWLKREHPKLYKATLQYVEDIAERLWIRDVETVRGLGFSQSEAMMQSYFNALSEALQFSSENDELMRSGGLREVGRAARVATTAVLEPVKIVAKALGFEFTDLMANVRALTSYRMIENIVRKSAIKWGDARKELGEFDPADPRWSMTPEEYSTSPRIGPDEENSLAAMRQFMSNAGTSLEHVMWDYYQRSQGGTVDAPVFGSAEDSVKRLVIGEINANMLTNRPQRAQSDPLASMFQILLGYSSNLSTQFLAAAKNIRGLTGMEKLAANFLKLVMGAIAALAIGLTQNFAVEFFSRGWLGRMSRNMTGLDKEFWNPDSRLPMRLAKPMLANVPFVGPLMFSIMQEQQGAKGAGDVASGIFAVGALSMLMTAVRAVIKLPAEDIGYALRKIVGPRVVPPIREASERFTDNESQKYLNGVNSFYAAAENAGVLDPNRMSAGASRSNNEITPKSVINAKIRDASMAMQLAKERGDTAGYDQARKEAEYQRDRLVKFEYDKIVEDATRRGNPVNEAKAMAEARIAARRDYQDLNPVTSVLGHSPTQAEYDIIDGNLSGEREVAAKRTFSAYQGISDLFPDSKGRTSEPQIVKAARVGGGGGLVAASSRFAYSRPLLTSARRGSVAGARRSGLSSYRSSRRLNPRFIRARRGRVSVRRRRR